VRTSAAFHARPRAGTRSAARRGSSVARACPPPRAGLRGAATARPPALRWRRPRRRGVFIERPAPARWRWGPAIASEVCRATSAIRRASIKSRLVRRGPCGWAQRTRAIQALARPWTAARPAPGRDFKLGAVKDGVGARALSSLISEEGARAPTPSSLARLVQKPRLIGSRPTGVIACGRPLAVARLRRTNGPAPGGRRHCARKAGEWAERARAIARRRAWAARCASARAR
jgi:hypothetical protein